MTPTDTIRELRERLANRPNKTIAAFIKPDILEMLLDLADENAALKEKVERYEKALQEMVLWATKSTANLHCTTPERLEFIDGIGRKALTSPPAGVNHGQE